MSIQQYLRQARLVVGGSKDNQGLDLSDLRFRFEIKRGDIQTPNQCDVRVYNVSHRTYELVSKEFTRVVIEAGYSGNYGLLFDGQLKQARYGRESPTDTYLDLTVADGDEWYNFSTMALSLAAGAEPKDAVQAIIKTMAQSGIGVGYLPDIQGGKALRGQVFWGNTRDQLRYLSRQLNCTWSIQDGQFVMIPLSAYVPGEIPVISPTTGLIGLPEQTANGIQVRILINPSIRIGQLIKLENTTITQFRYGVSAADQANNANIKQQNKISSDGTYYVMYYNVIGDTRGQDWYMDLTCLAVDSTEAARTGFVAKSTIQPPVGPIKPYG